MGTIITAWGCLALGIYRFYELSQNKNKYSKSEVYFRIGLGLFLCIIGCILLVRLYFN